MADAGLSGNPQGKGSLTACPGVLVGGGGSGEQRALTAAGQVATELWPQRLRSEGWV